MRSEPGRKSSLYYQGLNFERCGFFVDPIDENDAKLQADPLHPVWLLVQRTFFESRDGDFRNVLPLLEHYTSNDAGLAYVMYRFEAHAGNVQCFRRMQSMIKNIEVDYLGRIDFCIAMSMGAPLSAVPFVLDTFSELWLSGYDGIEMIPHVLGDQLEVEPGPITVPVMSDMLRLDTHDTLKELNDYRDLVIERYEELKRHFGTDDVHVFHGERYSVSRVAQRIMGKIAAGDYLEMTDLRERFEAATGINCSGFYRNNKFLPLSAAAIVEDFLNSKRLTYFEEGVRYFFSHRIPGERFDE